MLDAHAVIATAQTALRESAREHKHMEFAHRKAARRLMQLADELDRLGIGLQIVHGTDSRKEPKP